MKAVIARSNGQPDWDDVAEIIHMIKKDGQIVVNSEGGFWHYYKA